MIDEKEVIHVAKVARIKLTEKEVKKFSKELGDVIDFFKILDEVDVKNVEPSFHPIKTINRLREDVEHKGLDQKIVLSLAPHKEGDYFKTQKVV